MSSLTLSATVPLKNGLLDTTYSVWNISGMSVFYKIMKVAVGRLEEYELKRFTVKTS